MTKILWGAMLTAVLALGGCTIYLDIEESDKGDDSDDFPWDPADAGVYPDAAWWGCPDGTFDCFVDAGPPPCPGHPDEWGTWVCDGLPDAGMPAPDACPDGHHLPDGTWVCNEPPAPAPDAGPPGCE
jgi:hypothetical protein